MDEAEQVVKTELQKFEDEQAKVEALSQELEQNPKFAQFLEARKSFEAMQATIWGNIEKVMLENNIKSIKTDKIALTIAERQGFDIDTDLLPSRYVKKVPNTKLIGSTYKLEGKLPKGVTLKAPTQYLVKRVKG